MNTIKIPEGIDFMAVCGHAMKNNLVEISGGLGPSAGKVWRIGVMGNNANTEVVSKVREQTKSSSDNNYHFIPGTGSPERRPGSSRLEGSCLKTDGGEGTTVTEHHENTTVTNCNRTSQTEQL